MTRELGRGDVKRRTGTYLPAVAQATLLISKNLIDRYAAGPSATRRSAVKSLQQSVRKALEDAEPHRFDTFLQGSYRNGTAIADINDVDIVALYDPWRSPATDADWNKLFTRIAAILRNSWRVSGSVKINDKCVTLSGTLKADIVPAISRTTYSSTDPILIYSRRAGQERLNYPRTHYDNGVKKQDDTNDNYKATVRCSSAGRVSTPTSLRRRSTSSAPSTAWQTRSSIATCHCLSRPSRSSWSAIPGTRSSTRLRATRTSWSPASGTPTTSRRSKGSC